MTTETKEALTLSSNSKTKFAKSHKNTFGLMYGLPKNGGTCPGATVGKGGCLDVRDNAKRPTCYMAKITQIYKGVGAVLQKNTDLVKDKQKEELKEVIRSTINQFGAKSQADQLYFRLHYSGDFFSKDYVEAWAEVMPEYPSVRFWAYTRSLNQDDIETLLKAKNLSLYLSCDAVNYKKAEEIFNKLKDKYVNLALAWLGTDSPEPEKYRWVTCPETSGKLQNTDEAGACSKCRLCINNYKLRLKNIQFKLH